MALVYSPHPIINSFEGAVMRTLARKEGWGFIANNVLLPNLHQRWSPNEHDVILLLPHAAYTIDAKEYEPGEYRVPGNSPLEWRKKTLEENKEDHWRSVRTLPNPFHVAYQKQNILRTFLKKVSPSLQSYTVESLIVVPDHADVSPKNHDGVAGEQSFRLRILKLGELLDAIHEDAARTKGVYLPPQEKLEQVFKELGALPREVSECSLAGIQFGQALARTEPGCPVSVTVYRGVHEISGCDVEVYVYRKWPWTADADRFLAHCRRRVRALYETRARRVSRVVNAEAYPDVVVVAYLHFEGESLADLAARRGPLDEGAARALVRELCGTVHDLHGDGIVHLGLRPENVLIAPGLERHQGKDHEVIGFANPMVDSERITTQAFDSGYDGSFSAAEMRFPGHPERARPTCDVYALGRILAYAVLGGDAYRERFADGSGDLRGIPSSIARVVEDATAIRVSDRIPSVAELAKRL